ncbi:MAG: tRNA pseudouridine(55) synthase TruB [Clostridiales bacterium]|nr:tRNA pseudouridine(55) synthase TruB [Clostridiales bacterium]
MNGYFNILKPAGMSSAAVVAVMRRLTGEKHAGHAGTLDPEAAGVLPVMTGKAARLFDYLVDKEKEYEAVAAFGTSTDTQDATGQVLETGDRYPDLETVREKARELIGDIVQRPSMYSAIKVGGRPLYSLARKGVTAEVPERTVHIERIDVLGEEPDHGVRIRVRCGRGTYIRTLCDDLGKKCGCPAHMRSLVRTASGWFTAENGITLDEARALAAEGRLAEKLIPPDAPIQHIPRADVPEKYRKQVVNGAKIPLEGENLPEEGQTVRVYLDNEFWGMAVRQGNLLIWRAQIAPEGREGSSCG